MDISLQPFTSLIVLFLGGAAFVKAQRVVTADQIPLANQTYDFSATSRCRLAGHQSVPIKYGDNYVLVLTGGFGSFATELDENQVTVLDLNPYTVAFDLSKDFSTPGLEPLWMVKKSTGVTDNPPTNHGGIFVSYDKSVIYYQGGHFYNQSSWNPSAYHINKADIPEWQLWAMNVSSAGASVWTDVTESVQGHELAIRTFAGAAVSVPKAKKSFWIGGLIDPTTSSTTPNDTLQTTDQMLVYDHSTNVITREKYYSNSSVTGEWQGDLVYLPIGSGSGYLMSLMSLSKPLNSTWVDVDGPDGNQEIGDPKKLDSIPLYDIDSGTWFTQETSWFMNDIPEPRTRFCSAIFHDPTDNSWSLWVHGGQQVSNQNIGVQEIYVLSMPSFIWSKVETTLPNTNLIRSHTCHAIGGQLLIVGGYPPGLDVPTNATCDPEYIKVLDIGTDGVSWTSEFNTESTFVTPSSVRNIVNGRVTPIAGFANQKLHDDFAWQTTKPSSTRGAIAGGVIGGVLAMILLGLLAWRCRRRRYRSPEGRHDNNVTVTTTTSSLSGYSDDHGRRRRNDQSDGSQLGSGWYSPIPQRIRSIQWGRRRHQYHQEQPRQQQYHHHHRYQQQQQQQLTSPIGETSSPSSSSGLRQTGTYELVTYNPIMGRP